MASILLAKTVLDIVYASVVAPLWSYQNFPLSVDPIKLIESYVLLTIIALFLSRWTKPGTPSRLLLLLLVVATAMPILTYYGLADGNRGHLYVMMLGVTLTILASRIPIPRMTPPRGADSAAATISLLAVGVVIVRLMYLVGWRAFSVDIETAYATRLALEATVNAGIWGYLNVWAFKAFLPFLLVWVLVRRRYDLAALAVIATAIMFGFNGVRSALLFPLLPLYLLATKRNPETSIPLTIAAVAAGGGLLSLLGSNALVSLLVRRLLLVPAMLDFAYYEYFAGLPRVMLSNSILSGIAPYPFTAPAPALIGEWLFPGVGTWSNTGYLGTSFMHFGVPGVIAFSLLVGLMIALAVRLGGNRLPTWAVVSVVAAPFVTLFGAADLGTSLLTHGLLLSLTLLALAQTPSVDEHRRVVHMTVVHPVDDVRIFHKECRTLAAAGYEVHLIGPCERSAVVDGVSIHAIPAQASRVSRFLKSGLNALGVARKLGPAIYHFHDPELAWVGLVLRARGMQVVFDAHENTSRQILDKYWIPGSLRKAIAVIYWCAEQAAAPAMSAIVTVTPSIAARFRCRRTVVVRNYPLLSELSLEGGAEYSSRPEALAYTGGITRERGITEVLDALWRVNQTRPVSLVLAGVMTPAALERSVESHPAWPSVRYLGWIGRSEMWAQLANARAGLLLFHPRPNNMDSSPNKLFEYMAAGLPVIASDFPSWREVIESAECGLLVDPLDVDAISAAMQWILDHPEEADAMGRRGREAVTVRYNWESESLKLLQLYDGLRPITRES